MTDKAVSISITIKAGNKAEIIQKDLPIQEMEQMISSLGQEVSGRVMMVILDELDEEIRSHVPGSWRNIGRERRQVVFSHGHIHYARRIYRDGKGQRRKPLDELLGLEAYQRSSLKVREIGSVLAAQTSYRMAAQGLSYIVKASISPGSIQRMVWATGGRITQQEAVFRSEQAGKVPAEVLYAESDGVWIHLQRERLKRLEARVAVMYTGKKRVGIGRFGLENKAVMTQIGGDSLDWQVKLRELADHSYDLEHTQLLVVGGDGNRWVRQSFDLFNLPQEHVLDRYHVKRALRQSYGHMLHVPQLSRRLFSAGFEAVAPELMACIRRARGKQQERMRQTFAYLENNRDALVDLDKRGLKPRHFHSLGSIEGNVDKLAVHRMKGRGCCWRIAGAQAMLAILRHKHELLQHTFLYQPVIQPARPINRVKASPLQRTYIPPGAGMPIFQGCDQHKPWVRKLKSKMDSEPSLTRFF